VKQDEEGGLGCQTEFTSSCFIPKQFQIGTELQEMASTQNILSCKRLFQIFKAAAG
jgi:hypothetical protein